jgi:UDP-2,3-diacylglucosamine pyrophosphatase LpxH
LLGQEEERALLTELTSRDYDTVLVVSDLHLGVGRDRSTHTYPITENFYADDAFAGLLSRYEAASSLLVCNGDTFDSLRLTGVPSGAPDFEEWRTLLARLDFRGPGVPLERVVSRAERRFGLRTDDYKSIWKLARILDGHDHWRQALADWVANGGRLVFVKGNHDLELHWPQVRRFLRDRLVSTDDEAGHAAATTRVGFADGGFTLGNVYIEHGHQFERMTRVDGPPTLGGRRQGELRLPLGSFVNRYFINRIERLDPFIDNIKPVHQALLALLRRRPLELARIYTGGWRFMLRALTRIGTLHGAASLMLLAALLVPAVVVPAIVLWLISPEFRLLLLGWFPFLESGWVRVTGSVGGVSFPVLLPYLLGAGRELLSEARILRNRDALAEGAAARLSEVFGGEGRPVPAYAVMGHTHVETVKRLSRGPRSALYVNTGTWIGRWPLDRLDLAGRFIYSVARFSRGAGGTYVHDPLVWDDEARGVRPATILVPVAG